eukprot:TRINITY_DN17332_c0_g1_i1.p1 TRINITY_DN17332_c0_g1~~TRINITY_DN17332_c0_g1_i1.p1  ORF type:complete len:320 (+),score=35.11 TRINITY_DN17332_c0_g1_i1:36-962(+)
MAYRRRKRSHCHAHSIPKESKHAKMLDPALHLPARIARAILESEPRRLRQLVMGNPAACNAPHKLGPAVFSTPLSLCLGMLYEPLLTHQSFQGCLSLRRFGDTAASRECLGILLSQQKLDVNAIFYDLNVTVQTAISYLYSMQEQHKQAQNVIDLLLRKHAKLEFYNSQVDLIARLIGSSRMRLVDELLKLLKPCHGALQLETRRRPSCYRLQKWLQLAVDHHLVSTTYLLLQLGAHLPPGSTASAVTEPLLASVQHKADKGPLQSLRWQCYCRAYEHDKLKHLPDHEIRNILLQQLRPVIRAQLNQE